MDIDPAYVDLDAPMGCRVGLDGGCGRVEEQERKMDGGWVDGQGEEHPGQGVGEGRNKGGTGEETGGNGEEKGRNKS